MMKRIALLMAVLVARLILWPQPVLACSCMQPPAPQEAMAGSVAVFVGTVTGIQQPGGAIQSSADPALVTFEVSQVWKGPEFTNLLVQTSQSSASCGYEFEFGRDYLVYASGSETDLSTGLCSRTTLLTNAELDVTELGEATTPVEANPDLPVSDGVTEPAEAPTTAGEAAPQPAFQLPTVLLWGGGLLILLLLVLVGVFSGPKAPRARS
jgi:hypothetical protein